MQSLEFAILRAFAALQGPAPFADVYRQLAKLKDRRKQTAAFQAEVRSEMSRLCLAGLLQISDETSYVLTQKGKESLLVELMQRRDLFSEGTSL